MREQPTTDNGRQTINSAHAAQRISLAQWTDRAIAATLLLLALCAPHTIAGTQGAWLLAMLLWVVRLALKPRLKFYRTPVDYLLLGFFIITFISSLFSYDPEVSIGKLRAASLFTIVYVVAENVRTQRMLRALVVTLVASCLINTIYTFGSFAIGRGVRVDGVSSESPLTAAGLKVGDVVLSVDGAPAKNFDEIEAGVRVARAPGSGATLWPDGTVACRWDETTACLGGVRTEILIFYRVPRANLLAGETAAGRLGVTNWSRGRTDRARGFYGHYTTYAEVLQLIASLALGMLIALRHKGSTKGALLMLALVAFLGALVLTVTRASWLGLMVSAFAIVLTGASRRALVVTAAVTLLLVLVSLFVLQQKRQVGFLDKKDDSTAWRIKTWRDGFNLLIESPRHLAVGVGMDTIKRHWREWGMFEGGRIPWGHLHSTPLQIAFERGVPALLMWLALLAIYARMLWRLARREDSLKWIERGLALGALGGLAGFFTSGLVHYNLGDSEVVMVFYIIMGLALALNHLSSEKVAAQDN